MAVEQTRTDPHAVGGARGAILEGTLGLLQEHALDELSVAQILAAAGVSRATFYFYFASKDDVFTALLTAYIDERLPGFEQLMADPEQRRSPALRSNVAELLRIGPPYRALMRSAVEEWPRRPELRELWLDRQRRMSKALEKAIIADRKAGVAAPSIPAPQLAAGWMWMAERAWYEATGGARHMEDLPAVRDALAATLVAAVYGD